MYFLIGTVHLILAVALADTIAQNYRRFNILAYKRYQQQPRQLLKFSPLRRNFARKDTPEAERGV